MSKKAATKKSAPKITSVKKGEIYENKHGDLIEVANGRLKDEGELGSSFEGRTITFNEETKTVNRDKDVERFYLDELVRKLTKPEYDEWVAAGCREAEASVAATVTEVAAVSAPTTKSKGKPKAPAKEPAAKPAKSDGKMSAFDAAAKVLSESGQPMTSKAMIEAMSARGYWTSPGGQTPHATLYAAILWEINTTDDASRFTKTERGHFGLNAKSDS